MIFWLSDTFFFFFSSLAFHFLRGLLYRLLGFFNFPGRRYTFCPWNWKRSVARIVLVWFHLQTGNEADRLWEKSKSGQLFLFKSQIRKKKKKLHRSFILTNRHNAVRLCLFVAVGLRVVFVFLPSLGVSAVRSRWLCWYSWWWFPVERKRSQSSFQHVRFKWREENQTFRRTGPSPWCRRISLIKPTQ